MIWIREGMTVGEALEAYPETQHLLNWFGIETENPQSTLTAAAHHARFPITLVVSCLNRNLLRTL